MECAIDSRKLKYKLINTYAIWFEVIRIVAKTGMLEDQFIFIRDKAISKNVILRKSLFEA